MTEFGFCVVAALSSHTMGRPLTRSCRIGKSRFTVYGSKSPVAGVALSGTTSGEKSYARPGTPVGPGGAGATSGVPGNGALAVGSTGFAGSLGRAGEDDGTPASNGAAPGSA